MSRGSMTLRLMGACVLLFSDGVAEGGFGGDGGVARVYDGSTCVAYFTM